MPGTETGNDADLNRANELYWSSDLTVDEIVRELGVGRSALYSSIEPIPAGADCPECSSTMVFTNRTNRDALSATCFNCGGEAQLADASPARSEETVGAVADAGAGFEAPGGWSRWRDDLASVTPQRAAIVGGAAALGVVFGAAAARMIQEMR